MNDVASCAGAPTGVPGTWLVTAESGNTDNDVCA